MIVNANVTITCTNYDTVQSYIYIYAPPDLNELIALKTFWQFDVSMEKCLEKNIHGIPDSKVHGANMGPTWVLSAPGGPHVGPINLTIRDVHCPLFSNPCPHNLILLTVYILPMGISLVSLFNYCIMGIFDLTKVLVRLSTCHSYSIGVTTPKLQIWTWNSMDNPAFYNSENNGKIMERRQFVCLHSHQIHYMMETCTLIVVGITSQLC